MKHQAEIGIVGGTGIYDSGLLQDTNEVSIDTPYGKPSDTITIGDFKDRKIAFMPRHGKKHTIPPHMINYKANIWAFKELGVKRIIAPSAVGTPGDWPGAASLFRPGPRSVRRANREGRRARSQLTKARAETKRWLPVQPRRPRRPAIATTRELRR